jgi:hypothetical protein
MSRKCNTHRAKRNTYRIFMGKPGRPRSRWEDNIKMELRDI